jgi:CelD/BcsL family acetyltransferase involved in cellulose biosynthesis
MRVTLVPGLELGADLIGVWGRLRQANPDLASPYFHPEFTRIVASLRGDVEVAIIEDGGKVVGFFPFQRETRRFGRPVGHPLSDYHGVICAPDLDFDPVKLLHACGLAVWEYDHVLLSQAPFRSFHGCEEISPIIDLSEGFDRYVDGRKSGGSFRKPFQLLRKMEREVGSLSFQAHVLDNELLQFIMRRKSDQFKRTGVPDLFEKDWIRRTVETIFHTQTPDFGGMLSVLYAGSEVAAALMSIRSSDVCHAWFLGFEDRFSSYSPGVIFYLKFAEYGAGLGFRYLDIGKGDEQHKKRLMNASIAVGSGSVEVPSWLSFRRAMNRKLRSVVKASPVADPIRRIVHFARDQGKPR